MSKEDYRTSCLEGRSLWWRRTADIPRIMGLDARACFPIILVIVHPRTYTVLFAGVLIVVFAVLQAFRMSPPEAFRALGVVIRTFAFRYPVLRTKKRWGVLR